jgi:hypothetical protein
MGLGIQAWALGCEATAVMTLRTLKLAEGNAAAQAEAARMVTEKFAAVAELQAKAMTGALGRTPKTAAAGVLRHYGTKVRKNRRRLTRRR